jgi:hypothetical protein
MIEPGSKRVSAQSSRAATPSGYRMDDSRVGEDADLTQIKARQFAACAYAYSQFYFLSRARNN